MINKIMRAWTVFFTKDFIILEYMTGQWENAVAMEEVPAWGIPITLCAWHTMHMNHSKLCCLY